MPLIKLYTGLKQIYRDWWKDELDQLRQVCTDDTDLWHDFGCLCMGHINDNHITVKRKYKSAVKLTARKAEAELNDKSLLSRMSFLARESSNWYRMHKCRYWCQCNSGVTG